MQSVQFEISMSSAVTVCDTDCDSLGLQLFFTAYLLISLCCMSNNGIKIISS